MLMAGSCVRYWTPPPWCGKSRIGGGYRYHYNYNRKNSNYRGLWCEAVGRKDYYSNSNDDDNDGGLYPWDSSFYNDGDGGGIQWVPEDRVTLFTSQGIVQIGGSLLPRPISSTHHHHHHHKSTRHARQESDYMDPNQQLCLGALFHIAATNGLDMGRRLCIFGFCRSVEMLSDVVHDTVLEHGGEIVTAEKGSKGGLQEKLSMIVAVPLLWGVPPASETLHLAVRTGGGIVEKVSWQWDFL